MIIMNEFEIHDSQPLNDELESLVELWQCPAKLSR